MKMNYYHCVIKCVTIMHPILLTWWFNIYSLLLEEKEHKFEAPMSIITLWQTYSLEMHTFCFEAVWSFVAAVKGSSEHPYNTITRISTEQDNLLCYIKWLRKRFFKFTCWFCCCLDDLALCSNFCIVASWFWTWFTSFSTWSLRDTTSSLDVASKEIIFRCFSHPGFEQSNTMSRFGTSPRPWTWPGFYSPKILVSASPFHATLPWLVSTNSGCHTNSSFKSPIK
jgi:hypothetical protein